MMNDAKTTVDLMSENHGQKRSCGENQYCWWCQNGDRRCHFGNGTGFQMCQMDYHLRQQGS